LKIDGDAAPVMALMGALVRQVFGLHLALGFGDYSYGVWGVAEPQWGIDVASCGTLSNEEKMAGHSRRRRRHRLAVKWPLECTYSLLGRALTVSQLRVVVTLFLVQYFFLSPAVESQSVLVRSLV
jgi:hypothetical protein